MSHAASRGQPSPASAETCLDQRNLRVQIHKRFPHAFQDGWVEKRFYVEHQRVDCQQQNRRRVLLQVGEVPPARAVDQWQENLLLALALSLKTAADSQAVFLQVVEVLLADVVR